jgi:type 2A phosphatase activator TIP41
MKSELKIQVDPQKSKTITLDKFRANAWEFYGHKENMLSSTDLDKLQKDLAVSHLPEIFFGYNRFYMVNQELNFCYEINPLNMMNLTAFKVRNELFDKKGIYYKPKDVKVQYHKEWKNIKIDRDDIQTIEPVEDWTYSSPYMGNFSSIVNSELKGLYSGIENDKTFTVIDSDKELPVERLGPKNPILNYVEIGLYEDELNDNGLSETKFRFRVMKDCFFGLLRSYLRVDNVLVRNIDTRIFHSFGDNYIFRNFQVRESTYEELSQRGFDIKSSWSINPNQSDILSQFMGEPIFNKSDEIILM